MFEVESILNTAAILWHGIRKFLNEYRLKPLAEFFFFFSFLVFTKVETLCYPSVFLALFVYEKPEDGSKFICLGKSEKKD